ncbi:hypothetical protein QBC43DRAFT_320748 [Cladorrhinum sp. PSN259]|nr:hypothetical protein QBC43DRAFT_320748 [Cladorrhinum sp. PSN259]
MRRNKRWHTSRLTVPASVRPQTEEIVFPFQGMAALRPMITKGRLHHLLGLLGFNFSHVFTLPYYRFYRENTLLPVLAIAKCVRDGESAERVSARISHWKDRKLGEYQFVTVASTLLSAAVIGCFSWTPRETEHWLGPGSWYASLVLSITSVLLSSSQAFIFTTLKTSPSRPTLKRELAMILRIRGDYHWHSSARPIPNRRRRETGMTGTFYQTTNEYPDIVPRDERVYSPSHHGLDIPPSASLSFSQIFRKPSVPEIPAPLAQGESSSIVDAPFPPHPSASLQFSPNIQKSHRDRTDTTETGTSKSTHVLDQPQPRDRHDVQVLAPHISTAEPRGLLSVPIRQETEAVEMQPVVQVRWNMIFTWQAPMMLLSYSIIAFIVGLTVYICTPLYDNLGQTWDELSKAAVVYLVACGLAGIVFVWCSFWAYKFVDLQGQDDDEEAEELLREEDGGGTREEDVELRMRQRFGTMRSQRGGGEA